MLAAKLYFYETLETAFNKRTNYSNYSYLFCRSNFCSLTPTETRKFDVVETEISSMKEANTLTRNTEVDTVCHFWCQFKSDTKAERIVNFDLASYTLAGPTTVKRRSAISQYILTCQLGPEIKKGQTTTRERNETMIGDVIDTFRDAAPTVKKTYDRKSRQSHI